MVHATSAHVDTFCRENLPPQSEWPALPLDLPVLHYPERLNCATALLDDTIASLGGDRPALLAPGQQAWSYEHLRRTANRIAHLLTDELGVVAGNRVLLRGPNSPWLVACWFGALKAGAVVVATMPMLRSRELTDIHAIARIDLALCDHRLRDELAAVAPPIPTIGYGTDEADDLTRRIDRHSATHTDVATAADDV